MILVARRPPPQKGVFDAHSRSFVTSRYWIYSSLRVSAFGLPPVGGKCLDALTPCRVILCDTPMFSESDRHHRHNSIAAAHQTKYQTFQLLTFQLLLIAVDDVSVTVSRSAEITLRLRQHAVLATSS